MSTPPTWRRSGWRRLSSSSASSRRTCARCCATWSAGTSTRTSPGSRTTSSRRIRTPRATRSPSRRSRASSCAADARRRPTLSSAWTTLPACSPAPSPRRPRGRRARAFPFRTARARGTARTGAWTTTRPTSRPRCRPSRGRNLRLARRVAPTMGRNGAQRVHRRRIIELVGALCALALASSALSASTSFGASWLPPQQLSDVDTATGPSSELSRSEVKIAPDGTVIAAWLRSEGAKAHLEARIRPPAGDFGPVESLSPQTTGLTDPRLAVDDKGNAIAMWTANGAVQYALREAKEAEFGPPRSPLSGTVAGVDDVVFDSSGETIAVWSANDEVRASVRPPDGVFGASQTLDSVGAHAQSGDVGPAVVAADGSNGAFAVWTGSGTGSNGPVNWVSAAARPGGAASFGPLGEIRLGACGNGDCTPSAPAIAGGIYGAVTAWRLAEQSPSTVSEVQAARLPTGGMVPVGSGFAVDPPSAVLDARGTAVLGYSSHTINFFAQPPGATSFSSLGYTGLFGEGLRLAADGVGRTFAAWGGATGQGVLTAIRDTGGFARLQEVSGLATIE